MQFLPINEYRVDFTKFFGIVDEPWLLFGDWGNTTPTITFDCGTFSGESLSLAGGTLLDYQDFKGIELKSGDSLEVQFELSIGDTPKFTKFLPIEDYVLMEDVLTIAKIMERKVQGKDSRVTYDEESGMFTWGVDDSYLDEEETYAKTPTFGLPEEAIETLQKVQEKFIEETQTVAKLYDDDRQYLGLLEPKHPSVAIPLLKSFLKLMIGVFLTMGFLYLFAMILETGVQLP